MSLAAVAKLAGVSTMTVSRVVNGDPRVAAETVARVRAALQRAHYQPPSAQADGRRRRGRAPRGLHTGRVAVLVPDTSLAAMCTPLSIRWLQGLDRPLAGSGMQLILTRLAAPQTLPLWIAPRHLDGLIVRALAEPWLPKAIASLPTVWIFDPGQDCGIGDVVVPDDAAIGRMVTERVVQRGLNKVLVIDSTPGHLAHGTRIEALRAAAGRRLTVREHAFLTPQPAQADDLVSRADADTAIFMPGTGVTVAAIARAIARLPARRHPWLIACCHDRHLLASLDIPMANIDIGPEALGEAAANQLLRRIAEPAAPRARITLGATWEEGPFPVPLG